MRTGWLVVNESLKMEKFEELYGLLKEAGKKQECDLIQISNSQMWKEILSAEYKKEKMERENPDFVLFWDKDTYLAHALERMGYELFNSAKAVEICDDKGRTFIELMNAGILQPKTLLGAKVFMGYDYMDDAYVEKIQEALGETVVIKECFGSFGQQVYLAKGKEEIQKNVREIGDKPFVIQEFLESTIGRDIRINMVGQVPVAAMMRYNEDDFRANVTNGGKMKTCELTQAQIEMAQKVMKELDLDFAGIDILFGKEEEPIFCEVNSNAHIKNILDCTGINVADAIMTYILESIG